MIAQGRLVVDVNWEVSGKTGQKHSLAWDFTVHMQWSSFFYVMHGIINLIHEDLLITKYSVQQYRIIVSVELITKTNLKTEKIWHSQTE